MPASTPTRESNDAQRAAGERSPTTRGRVRIEPWPFVIAALLAAMIGLSVGFLRIALDHPDRDVSAPVPIHATQ